MDSIKNCLELRQLVDVLYDVQDVRMRTENRMRQMPKEASTVYSKPLRGVEDKITLEIEGHLSQHQIYTNWLYNVRGIGPRISGSIIAQTMIRFVKVEAPDFKKIVKAYESQGVIFKKHGEEEAPVIEEDTPLNDEEEIPQPFDTHADDASQNCLDTQNSDASHFQRDTHDTFAFSVEQVELAQKTGDGAYLIPVIRGIQAFDTVSKYWAWWGLDVRDGHAPKRVKGENINWNPKMRTLAWKIGKQFVMQGDRYRALYDQNKMILTAKRIGPEGELFCEHLEECQTKMRKRAKPACKGHIDAMAKRYAVKMFLSHLWQKWRELEGLPTRQPYVIEKMGHTTKQEP